MDSKRYFLISFFVAWCGLSAFAFGEKDGQTYPCFSPSDFWTCTLKANWSTQTYDVILSIADDYDGQDTFRDLTIPSMVSVDIDNTGDSAIGLNVVGVGSLGSPNIERSFTGTLTWPSNLETIGGDDTPVFQNCTINELQFDGDVTIGNNAFKDCTIDALNFKGDVTIDNNAFKDCTIGDVSYNSSDVELNSGAFDGCSFQTVEFSNANDVTIGSSVFTGCTIDEFVLSGNIKSIDNAFDGGNSFRKESSTTVKTLTIDSGIDDKNSSKWSKTYQIDCNIKTLNLPSDIGDKKNILFGFNGSTIDNVVFPDDLKKITGVDFTDCKINSMAVPDGVKEVDDDIFSGCDFTSDIDLKNVQIIGKSAFSSCNFEKSVTFDATGTVKSNSFANCTFGTSVNLAGIGTIGNNAFAGAYFPTRVVVEEATHIGVSTFEKSKLTKGIELKNVVSIGANAFAGATINDIDFGESLEQIGASAFENATFSSEPELPETLIGIGQKAFKGVGQISNLTIPELVETIGAEAFNECTGLTKVSIPASVTKIGKHAFCSNKEDNNGKRTGNDKFKTIAIEADNPNYKVVSNVLYTKDGKTLMRVPNGAASVSIASGVTTVDDYALHFCIDLKQNSDVALPATVTYIGEHAFEHCINLKDFKIPANVTTIKNDAFRDCHSLTEIKVPSGVTTIEERTFQRCNSLTGTGTQGGNLLPDGVTSIGNDAFEDCHSLEKVIMPTSLQTIGYDAFQYCYVLASPELPNALETIGSQAFSHCKAITDVTIPEKVTRIETGTFENCYSLKNLALSSNLEYIGVEAFAYCTSLPSVTIPSSVTTIDDAGFWHCYALKELTFSKPYAITQMGNNAFAYTSLTAVDLPNTLTSVSACAFTHCKDLTTVTIPENITNIGKDAFSYTGITSLTFPSTLQTIQANAFQCCNGIEEVTLPETLFGVGSHAFYDCMNLKAAYCFRPEPPVYQKYEPVYGVDWSSPDFDCSRYDDPTYEPPMILSGYNSESMDYDDGYVFDQCHPRFNVFVPIANVDNYKWENFVNVTLTTHEIAQPDWAKSAGVDYWEHSTSTIKIYDVLAPMVNHKSRWTTFCYFKRLDLTDGASGLTDKTCQVSGYTITKFDKEKRTTVAEKLNEVPTGTGIVLSGSVSAGDYFPLPLAPLVEDSEVVERKDLESGYNSTGSRGWNGSNSFSASGGLEDAYDLSNDSNPNSTKWGKEEMPADTKELRKVDYYKKTYTYTAHDWEWEMNDQAIEGTDNYLRGVTEETSITPDWGHTLFLLSGGMFYRMTTNGKFPAYKAYLDIPTTFEGYEAKPMSICFDEGMATGIDSLEGDKEDEWYDVRGCKLQTAPTQPGMYIRNGKKIIIK